MTVRQRFLDILRIWAMETRLILRDQGVLLFIVVVPLLYPILYTLCYNTESLHDVPVTVIDQDHTALSRQYIRHLDATPDIRVIAFSPDEPDALQAIREQQSYGYIVIPRGFSAAIHQGRQATVSAYCDMSGMLYYKAIVMANTNVMLHHSDRIRIQRAGAATARQEQLTNRPIDFEEVALFNPAAGMASFLIPAVLMLIIQQTLLLGIGMAAGTAYENHSFGRLVFTRNRRFTLHTILGIALSYFMVEILNAAWLTLGVPALFNLTQVVQPFTLALFMLPYLLACIFFAMTMSVLVRNREITMIIFVFTSVPLLFISGISWPWPAIPAFWKGFAHLFPSTWGINGFVRINTEGASLQDVQHEYLMLWIQTGFYFCTTYLVSRYILRRTRRAQLRALQAERRS